jgi:hypothetical protein
MSRTLAVNTKQISSSYGITSYSVRVSSMELYNYITLDVTFLDSENNVKDYRVITLRGQDYTNWNYDLTMCNDDYIMNKVCELCGFTMKSTTGWATRIGGTSFEEGIDMTTDSFGNVYTFGYARTNPTVFNNFVSGGTGGAVNLALYGNLTNNDAHTSFIVKHNSSGSIEWVTKIIGLAPGTFEGENFGSIAIDGDSNIYVCGYYGTNANVNLQIHNASGTVTSQTINTSVYGTLPLVTNQGGNGFLIKYNTDGVVQWATRISATTSGAFIIPRGVSVDRNGNVYLVGRPTSGGITVESFSSVAAGGGTITTSTYGTLSLTAEDGFLIKYNTNGIAQWATRLGGSSNEITRSVAVDPTGNIYVLGSSESASISIESFSSVGANGGAITTSTYGTISRTAGAVRSIVIAKYNTSGTALWATMIDGLTSSDIEYSVKVDNNGNLFVTGGSGSNPIRFYSFSSGGGGEAITTPLWGTISNTQSLAAFLVKYNTNGVVQWALRQGGNGQDSGRKLALDLFGNVYMTGLYSSSPLTVNSYDSGGGGGSAVTLSSYGTLPNTGGQDVYVIKYNTSGIAQWATSMTGTSGNERALAIAADREGVYVSGSFTSSTFVINGFTSGGTGGQIALAQYGTLENTGSTETFVVKYKLDGKLV